MNDYKRVLLVVLAAILLLPVGFTAKAAIDAGGEKNARMYNTAIQATETDRFNYAIDSHQGKLLGSGHFTPTQLVKFPEMNKEYAWVEKTKEEYTRHEREVCTDTYDSEGNVTGESCHTEVYYSWDYAGSDQLQTPAYKLHGREYPESLFNDGVFAGGKNCSEFMPQGSAGGWFSDDKGCTGGYYYTDGDTRYDYRVIEPSGFDAAFIADVSNGKLDPLGGSFISLERKSVEQMVKDANDYHTPGIVFIVFWWVLILGAMGGIAYAWSMKDNVWQ